MLQPKKSNPVQKTKRKTVPAQYTSDIDWDKVRAVNDNVAVQTAKMLDPTGISSYPDVYYAAKDLSEGTGSWEELGLNVLGALPMIGKAKTIFRLAKAAKASKTIKNTKKVINGIEEVANTLNKVTNPANIKPLLKAKSVATSSKQIGKADVKNVAIDLLDISNVGADATAVVNAATEEPSLVDKKKIIQYYNTDSKRGEVEKPGQLANVQYVPISNSVELEKWKEQKLAFGTNQQGIMKTKMNPRKKYANGTNIQGVGPNNYIQSPNEVLSDYSIMLAEADKQVANNSVVPIVSLVGGLLQQGISMAGSFKKAPGKTPPTTPEAANGMNNVKSNVEVEGGEMYETPQGETGEFQGPSHEQGGIPLEVGEDVEEGTKIYSDRLKIGKETLAERKEARERKIANLEKVASQPLIDAALKNATQRKMMAIQKEEAADLQFQEQVNNMQAMADTMVKAFGTSMAGLQSNPIGDSMEYGSGTGAMGVTEYAGGTGINGIDPPIVGEADYDMNIIKNWHDVIGITPDMPGYGTAWGTKSKKAFGDYQVKMSKENGLSNIANYNTDKDYILSGGFGPVNQKASGLTSQGYKFNPQGPDLTGLPTETPDEKLARQAVLDEQIIGEGGDYFSSYPNVFKDAQGNMVDSGPSIFKSGTIEEETSNLVTPEQMNAEDAAYYTPGQVGTAKVNPEGTMFSRGLEKGLGAVGKMGGMPGIGDLTSLFGDYLGATSGLKNAAESRSTDITHTNVYKDAGKESQKQLDNAMSSIEGSKAQAIVKATTNTQGSKRSGRNSARGVNQMRGMDWLYDTALNEQIASISANAAAQTADIYKSKSGVAITADQLKGEGQYKANMANEAAKDAYYTAKGVALRDQANAVKQGGKDINAIKQNKIIEKLMKSGYGKWVGLDSNMDFVNKNNSTTTSKTNSNVNSGLSEALKSMNLTSDNAGYITLPNGKKVAEKELLTLFKSNK
jgi:hypothetical protein